VLLDFGDTRSQILSPLAITHNGNFFQIPSDEVPAPDGPLTVGIDGGYVRGQHKQGQFEVIAGKSLLAF
jgi:hypothetical protein